MNELEKQIAQMIDAKLLENNMIFRRFFYDSIVGQSITLSSGQIHINDAFCNMLGYTRDEIRYKTWQDITHPDDLIESQKAIDDISKHQSKEARFVKRYIKKDGEIIWCDVHTTLCTGVTDDTILLTTVIDITDKYIAQQRLIDERNMFQTFINATEDIVYLKNDSFKYVIANNQTSNFYGVDLDKILGHTNNDFLPEEVAKQCLISDKEAVRKKGVSISIEEIASRYYEAIKFPVTMPNNKIGIGGVIRDITEQTLQKEKIDKISETNNIIATCLMKPFTDKHEYLDYALNEALRLTKSLYGYILYFDEKTDDFILTSQTHDQNKDTHIVDNQTYNQLEKTAMWDEAARQRKPLVCNNHTKTHPIQAGYINGPIDIKRFMTLPIIENGKLVAVISLSNKETDYTDSDITPVTILMNGIWNAIQKREIDREKELLLEQTTSMFQNHEAVMLLIDPLTSNIIDANPAATEFYGYSKEELLKLKVHDINILPVDDVSRLIKVAAEKGQRYFTFPHRLKNGSVKIVDVYSSPIAYNNRKVLFSIIFDVSDREEAIGNISYISYHDYLTGLYNRRYFEEQFTKLNKSENFPIAIIMGDVNGLKLVNDSLGHNYGDELLLEAAQTLKANSHKGEIVARVGGDEFAILMIKIQEEEVRVIIDILEALSGKSTSEDPSKPILSIAYGYAIQAEPGIHLNSLMKEAEGYLYRSKYYDDTSIKGRTVDVIMNTLFEKSEREKEHSQRVSQIAAKIAEALDFTVSNVNKVRTAALLHDIGKIGIQESILNKKGRLTPDEWTIMKSHVERSYRILKNSVEFADIADICRFHHEHWDGTGYPQGKKGKEIPFEARIIAIADAYDAMTNVRSYKAAITHEAAIAELIRCSKTQFDAEIVEAFLKVDIN